MINSKRRGPLRWIWTNCEDSNGVHNVFDLLLALVLETGAKFLSLDLRVNLARDANCARVSKLLQAGCNIDPVVVKIAVRTHDDLIEVDTNTQPQRVLFGMRVGCNPLLERERAADRVEGTGELAEKTVTSGFD